MTKNTIRLDGKKHTMPNCFVKFFADLEALVGVERVGTGNYWQKGPITNQCLIKYYDTTTHTLKVNITGSGWTQDFYVRIEPLKRTQVEQYILSYNQT